jgi:hypothetical protein
MEGMPRPLPLPGPPSDYHIPADERARIVPGFDVEALERLLARVVAERRDEVLAYFQFPRDRSAPRLGILKEIKYPELQAILEEVWAPMWDHVGATDEDLRDNVYEYPGREIALAHRAAAQRQ